MNWKSANKWIIKMNNKYELMNKSLNKQINNELKIN